ncbi:hypothetical protein BLBCPU_186 [Blattabacterium sp. (Cryptocercus punctulatus) str. Cpu]|nr:hypothetical protein BLBCPU_186 [Blattabacterium sp. (Cryptocercus punctulatus) str. Cpu]
MGKGDKKLKRKIKIKHMVIFVKILEILKK